MFCLRIWLLPLFFLSTAPPLYLLLFLTATYILQRPCVYCSLLLAVFVLALFDFSGSWFETRINTPPLSHHFNVSNTTTSSDNSDIGLLSLGSVQQNASAAIAGLLADGVGMLAAAVNGTAGMLAEAAVGGVQGVVFGQGQAEVEGFKRGWLRSLGVDWAKSVWRRGEIRIPCVNAVIRL